jgi:hypothetical protein
MRRGEDIIRRQIQHLVKQHRKKVGEWIHLVPAPPLIYFVFDIALPLMLRRKDPRKWKGVRTDFQFTFSDMPGRKSWVLEIDDGRVRMYRGEKDMPHLVINSSARDFIDLMTGYLPEAKAMMSGRLAINGGPATKLKTVMALFR